MVGLLKYVVSALAIGPLLANAGPIVLERESTNNTAKAPLVVQTSSGIGT
jgi:hypothetical protein